MYKDIVIQYLASCFIPINITTTIEEWRTINYHNRLFNVEIIPDLSTYNQYNNLHDKRIPQLNFMYAKYSNKQLIPNPATMMTQFITGDMNTLFDIDIHNKPDNELFTFKSNGKIPNRYIRMLHDFYFNKSTIEEEKADINYWTYYVNKIPDESLKVLIVQSIDIMNVIQLKLTIHKAPNYYNEKDKWMELCNIPQQNTTYIQSIISRYQELIINGQITDPNYLYNYQLKNKIWFTGDRIISYPVKILLHKCKKYTSLHKNESIDNNPIGFVAKSEGGLSLYYHNKSPWAQLYLSYSIHNTCYGELVGHNIYYSNKNAPTEEFVILEEILKKEGAEYTIDI